MHLDAELVLQAFTEIRLEPGQPFEQDRATRVQVDLVRLRRQQVLALVVAVAIGDDLLACRAELAQGIGHFAQRRHAGTAQGVGAQHDALDPVIVGSGLDRLEQIAQLHLGHFLAQQFGERSRARVGAILLHQIAIGRNHQCGALVQDRAGREHGGQDEQHDQQEQHIDHEPATEIDRMPDTRHQPDQQPARFIAHERTPNEIDARITRTRATTITRRSRPRAQGAQSASTTSRPPPSDP